MLLMTRLPVFVKFVFVGMPHLWKGRHQLYFTWFVVLQITSPNRKSICGLCSWSPKHICEWHLRRLLNATYWSAYAVLDWFATEAIASFPRPADGIIYVLIDGSHKDKRTGRNPFAQKGKKTTSGFYFFGIRFVLLCVCWGVYRIPVDFEIVWPKEHPDYQNENQLARKMLQRFQPPAWAKRIIVLGDSGFASKDNIKLIQTLRWNFVFSLAKTWKSQDGKAVKNLVKHLPKHHFKKTWVAPINEGQQRRYYWYFLKKASLNHIGDVTLVLSKKGRNVGPKATKILVTNLKGCSARQILSCYQKRWSVELLFKELKSGLGLGQHQVTKNPDRIRKSFAMAIIAYLVLIRIQKHDIQPQKAWSIWQLKQNMLLRIVAEQSHHNAWKSFKKVA